MANSKTVCRRCSLNALSHRYVPDRFAAIQRSMGDRTTRLLTPGWTIRFLSVLNRLGHDPAYGREAWSQREMICSRAEVSGEV